MKRLIVMVAIAVTLVGVVGIVTPATAKEQIPPATNIQVANGLKSGEIIITWEAVPEAAYYRIGSINIDRDYSSAKANGDWMEAFTYVDVANRRQDSHTILGLEPGAYHAFVVLTNDSRHGQPT